MSKNDEFGLFFWRIYFDLSLSLSFLPSFPSLLAVWLLTFGVELWLEREKCNIQRVVCKQRDWQWIFPQNVTFECNSVRISQDIQNEVSLERSIFADVVAYRFIN